jgi:hypothetical protein
MHYCETIAEFKLNLDKLTRSNEDGPRLREQIELTIISRDANSRQVSPQCCHIKMLEDMVASTDARALMLLSSSSIQRFRKPASFQQNNDIILRFLLDYPPHLPSLFSLRGGEGIMRKLGASTPLLSC